MSAIIAFASLAVLALLVGVIWVLFWLLPWPLAALCIVGSIVITWCTSDDLFRAYGRTKPQLRRRP